MIGVGVVAGLVLGKFLGIMLGSWIIVRLLKVTSLPRGVTWGHIMGAGLLAGIGFTLSIFIAELAFENTQFIDAAKVGIFIASIISGTLGLFCLWRQPYHRLKALPEEE